ncbi:hypothetical protein FEE95_03085 [Maribacter algarum]|uniref:Uncharacterized protein n=1 Tax=Maribacter algarum (ex Zhang et al. 2020) TaxID=2578118 RepID=A0A5S3PU08_9FLAO|nr:hypothetical protein [Maribacter algarum]TMM58430.1 hypothetical protein FEE95_03085 [Maribacter algarum]
MTIDDFNHKWKRYLGDGHYGMDINIPEVILYLDSEFDKEVKINPDFQYFQIKLKYEMCVIYAESDKTTFWQNETNTMLGNTEPKLWEPK